LKNITVTPSYLHCCSLFMCGEKFVGKNNFV
jgi:hypothetical protein